MSIITDEMVDRATQVWLENASDYTRLHQSIRAALTAILPDILEAAAKVAEDVGRGDEYDDVRIAEAIRALT